MLSFLLMIFAGLDVTTIPQAVADTLNTSLTGGQLVCTAILVCIVLFPLAMLSRNPTLHIIGGTVILAVATAFGWCPYWLMLMEGVAVGILFANNISKMLSNSGGGSD